MAKWNFFVTGGSLIKELDTSGNDVEPRSQSFMQPSLDLEGGKIVFKESGQYKTAIYFSQIGTIASATPTDIQDAYDKLIALIPTSGGGGGGSSYNNVTAYDTVADLPITFATGTIHSISILCITGTLVVTISGEQTTLIAGQKTDMEATGLLTEDIVINSSTGTFLATTIN